MDGRFFSYERKANNQTPNGATASKAEVTPDVLTLKSVADPIVKAVVPEYRAPLAIMIARAYIHADNEKHATAFLQKLHNNQKQIIKLVEEGATPSDLFCFGICLWVQNTAVFKKRLDNYCHLKESKGNNKDSVTNTQCVLIFLKESGVILNAKELNECFNSPTAFTDLFTAVHDAALMSAYPIFSSKVNHLASTQHASTLNPVHALVAAGKQLNVEFIEGRQQSNSGFNENIGLLNQHYNKVKPNISQDVIRDHFLILLKNEIDDPKWDTLGRFGRRAPDGIQQLRDLFSKIKKQRQASVDSIDLDSLFERVKAILASKQTAYFGFGRREDATAQFYMEQYNQCQSIVTPKKATPTPGKTFKA